MIEDIVLEFSDPSELVMETDRPLDLLDDTVSESTVLSGVRFHRPDGQVAYGECTYDADTSDGTATAAWIVSGKTAYVDGEKVTGTLEGIVSTSVGSSNDFAYSNKVSKSGLGNITIPYGSTYNLGQYLLAPISVTSDNVRVKCMSAIAVSNVIYRWEGSNDADFSDIHILTNGTVSLSVIPVFNSIDITDYKIKYQVYLRAPGTSNITITAPSTSQYNYNYYRLGVSLSIRTVRIV